MKCLKAILVAFVLVFNVNAAVAGSGHHHGPVTKQQAGYLSENIVQNMALQGELSSHWVQASPSSLDKVSLEGNRVWRAVFTNDQETTPEKRKLTVYLTLTGGFLKADYSTK